MRFPRRSTITRYPALLWSALALAGFALHAFSAAAQAPGFTLNPPPTTDPTIVEQEKRAAHADAEEAARDNAKARAEIARERLAAQADAQAASGRGSTKNRAAKVAAAEISAKAKRPEETVAVAEETAAATEPEVPAPAAQEPAAQAKPKAKAKPDERQQGKGKGKVAAKPAKRRGRQPTEAYRKLRDSWLAPMDAVPTIKTPGRIPLVLSSVNSSIMVSLIPQRDDGGFDEADLQRAASAFAPRDMESVHPIAPRLLDLVYRAMRHFDAPLVHIVSGYRKDRAGSRHTQGRAIDMALPGVSNEALAEHVRGYGFCGVGIYPKSGFVHLDVRDRSYFWLDNSMPGERSRITPILADEALAADRSASARGETPDTYVPDNEAEDRAAARAYARRAKLRRERALREAARAQQRSQAPGAGATPSGAAKPAAIQRSGVL